jgi:DNA-binding transcriptional MocR family regulator
VATVVNQKDHKSKDNLDKCYKVVQQSGTEGIRAIEIAEQLGIDRTTVHRHLTSLDLRGKVESKNGRWFAKTGEQTTKPLEKEIVIELPMPKDQWQRMVLLEAFAKDWEKVFPETESIYRISLEKLRETRTIRIKGKNVDDLDLEKLGNLIKQANEKSSLFDFRGLFKSLKRSRTIENPRAMNNNKRDG